MKMDKFLSVILGMGISLQVFAQSNLDNMLSSVSKNNKSLLTVQQQGEAKKLGYNTGIYLSNPVVEYDYLYGSPVGAGNQTDFNIIQSFDFPSAYIKRKQVITRQVAQIDYQITILRQDILLQAKQTCIHLIYLNKRQNELNRRLKNVQSLYDNYKKKLEKGDASVLDVNKAKLQLLNIQTDFQLNQSEINQANQKLTELNGGTPVTFTDTIYPPVPAIPDFKTLESTIEASDPNLKYFETQKEVYVKEMQLSKALWLPKFETGYHQQAILGQKFQGAHFGITIPLWERKNTVKHQKAQVLFGDMQIQEHRNEHYHHIQQLYEKYLNLQLSITEYQKVLNDFSNLELHNKALALGQISLIEYSLEISNYYESFNKYLLLEKEYFNSIAELYKFTL